MPASLKKHPVVHSGNKPNVNESGVYEPCPKQWRHELAGWCKVRGLLTLQPCRLMLQMHMLHACLAASSCQAMDDG